MEEMLVLEGLPFSIFIEDPTPRMPPVPFLDEPTYTLAIGAFVIVCTDTIPICQERRTVYLARRCVKPMEGWWVIGGRMYPGEKLQESMQRCFRRETKLELAPERFKLIALHRYLWTNRQQEPQDYGSDNLAFTFRVELTDGELAIASSSLDSKEYEPGVGLQEFDLERLHSENVHPMIIRLYQRLFPPDICVPCFE